VDEESDTVVDLGASWIHGHEGNPLVDLAEVLIYNLEYNHNESMEIFFLTGKCYHRVISDLQTLVIERLYWRFYCL
jgi:hypothetical protein